MPSVVSWGVTTKMAQHFGTQGKTDLTRNYAKKEAAMAHWAGMLWVWHSDYSNFNEIKWNNFLILFNFLLEMCECLSVYWWHQPVELNSPLNGLHALTMCTLHAISDYNISVPKVRTVCWILITQIFCLSFTILS